MMATLRGRVTVVISNTFTGSFSCTVSKQIGVALRKSLLVRPFVSLFSIEEVKHILTYVT